ncbi:hypothetical protein WDU94_010676 [Cyamophila willieti]
MKVQAKYRRAVLPSMLFTNSVYSILFTVCLTQLWSLDMEDYNESSRKVLQCVTILMVCFTHYLSSETLDTGNDILYKALVDNQWYNVRPDVRKLMIPILVVTKKPKRLTYFGGAVDMSFPRFLKMLKFSYSSFTLLKHLCSRYSN